MEKGYCLDEKAYDAEAPVGGAQGGRQRGRGGEEVQEWAHKLEEFQVPAVSEAYFLDGCKVSSQAWG